VKIARGSDGIIGSVGFELAYFGHIAEVASALVLAAANFGTRSVFSFMPSLRVAAPPAAPGAVAHGLSVFEHLLDLIECHAWGCTAFPRSPHSPPSTHAA
jgi:hypothetical protein